MQERTRAGYEALTALRIADLLQYSYGSCSWLSFSLTQFLNWLFKFCFFSLSTKSPFCSCDKDCSALWTCAIKRKHICRYLTLQLWSVMKIMSKCMRVFISSKQTGENGMREFAARQIVVHIWFSKSTWDALSLILKFWPIAMSW